MSGGTKQKIYIHSRPLTMSAIKSRKGIQVPTMKYERHYNPFKRLLCVRPSFDVEICFSVGLESKINKYRGGITKKTRSLIVIINEWAMCIITQEEILNALTDQLARLMSHFLFPHPKKILWPIVAS